jgi:hypothetical protein
MIFLFTAFPYEYFIWLAAGRFYLDLQKKNTYRYNNKTTDLLLRLLHLHI